MRSFHTVFAERIRASEERHPPFLRTKIRLVSEACVGDGEHLHFVQGKKAAFEE